MTASIPWGAEAIASWARPLAQAVFAQLWQSAAVAAVLAAGLRLAPRTRASHRFALWLAAFVLVAALPLLPYCLHSFQVDVGLTAAHAAAVTVAVAHPWMQLDTRWALVIALFWLVATTLRMAQLAAGAARVRALWRAAWPMEPARSAAIVGEGSVLSLPLRGCVELCTSTGVDRPSVIGFFRPRVLLPEWLAEELAPAELRPVVLHELEHLRRFDDWINLALRLIAAGLAINPVLWWMEQVMDREREMATDEAVVRRTRAPRAYAACLASVAERRMQHGAARRLVAAFELGAWRRRSELAERILSLLAARPTLGPLGRLWLAAGFGAALVAGVTVLAHAPQLVAFAPAAQPQEALAHSLPGVASSDVALASLPQRRVMVGVKPSRAEQDTAAIGTVRMRLGARVNGSESAGGAASVPVVEAAAPVVAASDAGADPLRMAHPVVASPRMASPVAVSMDPSEQVAAAPVQTAFAARPDADASQVAGVLVMTVYEQRGNLVRQQTVVAGYTPERQGRHSRTAVLQRHASKAALPAVVWQFVPMAQTADGLVILDL